MRRSLVRVGFDCVAQPAIKQATAPASVRLRHRGICSNRALHSSPCRQGQAIICEFYLGVADGSAAFWVISCGQPSTYNLNVWVVREIARAVRTTLRSERDLQRAFRAVFLVGFFFFSRLPEFIDRANKQEDCSRHDEKVNQQGNEVSIIPSNRSGFRGVSGSVECHRPVFSRSQNYELV